jgi:cell division protease FtsH
MTFPLLFIILTLTFTHIQNTDGFRILQNNIFRREKQPKIFMTNELVDIANQLLNQNIITGDEWTFLDLTTNIHSNNVVFASIFTNKNAIAVIDRKYSTEITKDNIHIIYTLPYLTDQIIELLKSNQIVFDINNVYSSKNTNIFYVVCDTLFSFLKFFGLYITVLTLISILTNKMFHTESSQTRHITQGGNTSNPLTKIFNRIMGRKTSLIDNDIMNLTYDDVAGCEEAKYELTEIVEFLKNPYKFDRVGAVIPTGILLEGPPGTGKTLLARATAGEANVSFISASGSDFVEVFVGVGASRVRDLFEKARKKSPCIIFIDEIDTIGRQRSGGYGGNDERDQTLNQLLTTMDGFTKNSGVIVMAATNRADILDNALTRPGRFDRKVKIALPDKIGREQILQIHLKNKYLHSTTNLDIIYDLTSGFSGADLSNLANEAAILSVRYNEYTITDKCLMDAYEKITIGLPKVNDTREKNILKMIAYHEAGHTLLAMIFKDMFDVRKVTINANNNGAGGYTLFTPKEKYVGFPTKKFMLAKIMVALGGRAAEVLLYRKNTSDVSETCTNLSELINYNDKDIFTDIDDLYITSGASNDLLQANKIARQYVELLGLGDTIGTYNPSTPSCPYDNSVLLSDASKRKIDKEIQHMINHAFERTINILEQNEDSLDKLSELLLEKKTISSDELYKNIHMKYVIWA